MEAPKWKQSKFKKFIKTAQDVARDNDDLDTADYMTEDSYMIPVIFHLAVEESSNVVRRDRRLGDKVVRSVIVSSEENDSTEVRVGGAAIRGHGRRLEAR